MGFLAVGHVSLILWPDVMLPFLPWQVKLLLYKNTPNNFQKISIAAK